MMDRVPKLRFPEYGGEWDEIKLGELLSFKNGINGSKELYGKGYKFINVLDIINNNIIKYDDIIGSVDISEKSYEKNKIKYGDILFQRSSETRCDAGQSNVYMDSQENVTFGGFVIRGQKKKEYKPLFINSLLKTSLARKEITQKSNGSTRFNVGQETLSKVIIFLPLLPEQQKIASFLTTVDTKIEQLTKKKTLLEQYKTGVSQKLFSQEIRFKADDGSEYPDWVEKTINDLPIIISDGNYGEQYPTSKDFKKSGIPFLRANNIKNLKVSENDMRYITEEQHQVLTSGHLKTNDILITTRGELGNIALVDGRFNNANINAQICLLRINDSSVIYYKYLLISLNSFACKKQYKAYETGTALKQLPKGNLKKIKINLPSLPEQEKIANFLSSIETKIDQATKQLNQTKQFKKALLQQMFV